jgi:hypothetical protein
MNSDSSTPAGDTGTPGTKTKSSQTAKNDDRCDASKHVTLPKDCNTKSGTGAAAANAHGSQSGGDSSASGSSSTGASGSPSSGGSSSSSSSGSSAK